ncbi:MAG: restriction endonuclease subunit S [Ignavibacteria bacterium]|nr:restriction endonuclease subunit S [Ignavibacteria bacterium]
MSSKKISHSTEDEATAALVPRLRFPEFQALGGWSPTQLNSIADPLSERAIQGDEGNVLSLSVEHGIILQSEFFGKKVAGDNLERYLKVSRNDFVYNDRTTKTSTYGTIKRLSKYSSGIVSPIYKCFRFHADENPVFWEHYFESGTHDAALRGLVNEGARAGRFNISITQFLSTFVFRPNDSEEQRIAECLSSLDELIAAQAANVNALKTHKEGLMQLLFPREGETQPRLRFPEFRHAGLWKQRSLRDISHITSGSTPSRSNLEFFTGGTIPWVKTTDLNNTFIVETEEKITARARARINPVGSVLIAMYGGFNQIGRTGCLSIPAATNQAISVLTLDRLAVVPTYVLAWLNAKVDYWKRIASSSRKDPNITGTDVANFTIVLPNPDEQQRIASCLSSIDALITTEIQKLEALKTHKKSLMQQLFPSPEEVEA